MTTTLAASLLLAQASVAAKRSLPSERQDWVEVRTPSFTVFSRAGKRKTREITNSFERLREALQRLKPQAASSSPIPTRILVFDNDRSYRPYKAGLAGDSSRVVGHFAHRNLGNFIAINAYPKHGDALPIVYHEYLHAFLNVNFPTVPLWFNEGLAEFYSTFRLAGDRIEIGRPVEQHVQWLRQSTFIPLAELFSIDESSPHYREGERAGLFYSQSWLLVHYLLASGPESAEDTARFLDAVGQGHPVDSAFRDAFGMGYAELEKRLRRYVDTGRFTYYKLAVGDLPPVPEMTLRELPRAEVLYQLGTYLALFGQTEAARDHLDAALKLTPDDGDSLSSLAYVEQVAGHHEQAGNLFAQASTASSQEALSMVLQAGYHLDRCSQTSRCDALPSIRERLHSALEIDPSFAEAWAMLGNTYLFEGAESAAGGLPALRTALEQLPRRDDIAFNLAMLYLRTDSIDSAREVIAGMQITSGSSELLKRARRELELSELTLQVNQALAGGDAGTIELVVREALARTDDPILLEKLRDILAQVEQAHRREVEIGRFEEALTMAQAGEIDQARIRLTDLLSTAIDSQVRLAAQDLLDQIDRLSEP